VRHVAQKSSHAARARRPRRFQDQDQDVDNAPRLKLSRPAFRLRRCNGTQHGKFCRDSRRSQVNIGRAMHLDVVRLEVLSSDLAELSWISTFPSSFDVTCRGVGVHTVVQQMLPLRRRREDHGEADRGLGAHLGKKLSMPLRQGRLPKERRGTLQRPPCTEKPRTHMCGGRWDSADRNWRRESMMPYRLAKRVHASVDGD